MQEMKPDGTVIDLPGLAGLNAAEHLCSLCPGCGLSLWLEGRGHGRKNRKTGDQEWLSMDA